MLADRRFGLLFNQASVAADGRYAADALASLYGPKHFVCTFSPQHGLWGEEQANMIETGHSLYRFSGVPSAITVPLYSLYSETRAPTDAMLEQLDVLVIDLQDVGTRVYTFLWTMLNCLEACSRCGVQVLVLDRPNPLGGLTVEGQCLLEDYRSFVGLETLPMRHGLTLGEAARYLAAKRQIDVELSVVPMLNWQRDHRFADCGTHWLCPSPNMPTYRTTCVYPGGVLLEGTNLSEGRGTTIPFEVVGAPFIDEYALAAELNGRQLPGVRFRPTRFRPTFDKWQGQSCHGIYLDVTDERAFQAYRTTLHLLQAIRKLHGEQLQWLPPPYEYEQVKLPINILAGSDQVRQTIDQSGNPSAAAALEALDHLATTESSWLEQVRPYWLY